MAGECLFRQGKTAEAIEAWKQVMINYGECDFGKLADIMIAEIQGR
jgi:TolA-binding protein